MARKIIPTERQKLLAKLMFEDGRNKYRTMIKAGYSHAMATQPQRILGSVGYKEANKEFVELAKKERMRLIKAMSVRDLKNVDYDKMARATDTLTKQSELLTGGETQRVGMTLTGLFDIVEAEDEEAEE